MRTVLSTTSVCCSLFMDDLHSVCVSQHRYGNRLFYSTTVYSFKSSHLTPDPRREARRRPSAGGNLFFQKDIKTTFRFKGQRKGHRVLPVKMRRSLVDNVPFSPSELLEAPSAAAELEAVRKAKILYRSCMNESELQRSFGPFAP